MANRNSGLGGDCVWIDFNVAIRGGICGWWLSKKAWKGHEMTIDELDKLAAEKIFGWVYFDIPRTRAYWSDGENHIIDDVDWNPTENIAQAWECLEKFETWRIYNDAVDDKIEVHVLSERDIRYGAFAVTAPLAIVKACLKAKGIDIGND